MCQHEERVLSVLSGAHAGVLVFPVCMEFHVPGVRPEPPLRVSMQVDAILTANAQIDSAGGNPLDDAILRPMLDNALPQSLLRE